MDDATPRSRTRLLFVLLALAAFPFVWANELPDLELNPETGHVESVDTNDDDLVRHVEDPGQGGSRTSTTLSTSVAKAPRIAINGDGDSYVVWWQDGNTDKVFFIVRDLTTGDWTTEKRISEPQKSSRHPEMVSDETATWIVWEYDDGTDTGIATLRIVDDSEPFPTRTIVDITDYTGDADVMVHAESGHVWISWVDSSSDVAWSEYDDTTELWSTTDYESYAGSDIETARDNVRDTVLGN